MIEATYKTARGNLLIRVSGDTVKDIFEGVSQVQAVFDADTACGLCHSGDIEYRVRTTSTADKYYELACRACAATLSFGQHKTGGTLFVKRKDGMNGWKRYAPLPEAKIA